MSGKKNSFKKGDRVSAPGGKDGTVRFVGKVHWTKGTWVGVEFDDPVGKHDGTERGKRYFRCKSKKGIIQKPSYFTKAGKGSKKGKSSKSGKPEKKSKGKKKSKHGGGGGGGGEEEHKSAPKVSKRVVIETQTNATQTDVPTEVRENSYYCKIITRLYEEQNQKLTHERDSARQRVAELESNRISGESTLKQMEYALSLAKAEPDQLRAELEFKEMEIEELKIQIQMVEFDLEDLKEKMTDNIDTYVSTVSTDTQEQALLVKMNEELQAQLAELYNVGQELIQSKDKHIINLLPASDYTAMLANRVKDLLQVEREVLSLKSQVGELKVRNSSLEDSETMLIEMNQYNNELEGELKDWREYVLDVEEERQVLNDMHSQDDVYIQELNKSHKELTIKLEETHKSSKQLTVEHKDLQKELFELRNEVQSMGTQNLDDMEFMNFAPDLENDDGNHAGADDSTVDIGSAADMASTSISSLLTQQTSAGYDGGLRGGMQLKADGNKKLEMVWKENMKLHRQLQSVRGSLINLVESNVRGQGDYVYYHLMRQYLPKRNENVDMDGLRVLSDCHRLLYKAKACRELLETFYCDPTSASLKNPGLAMSSFTLCPLLLTQENYFRAIQQGFLSLTEAEVWLSKVSRFQEFQLTTVEKCYTQLLKAIDAAAESGDLEFKIETLTNHEARLKKFVEQHFVKFSPDRPMADNVRADKNVVLENISVTHYRFQELSIKLNQFNSKMHALVHAAVETTKTVTVASQLISQTSATTEEEYNDDTKLDDGDEDAIMSTTPALAQRVSVLPVTYQESVEDVIGSLKIGALEKLFRLRNNLMSQLKKILTMCQPVELGFKTEKVSANLLQDGNTTPVKISNLKACKMAALKAVQRVDIMLEAIKKLSPYLLPRKRIDAVNKIIENEEEANEDGLINVLENAYDSVSQVNKLTKTVLYADARCTDDIRDNTYDEFVEPQWEIKATAFRSLFERISQDQIRMEQLEERNAEIQQEKMGVETVAKLKNQTIKVLQQKILAEKENSQGLIQLQIESAALIETNGKQAKRMARMDIKQDADSQQIALLTESINKYKKAVLRDKDRKMPQYGKLQRRQSIDDINVGSGSGGRPGMKMSGSGNRTNLFGPNADITSMNFNNLGYAMSIGALAPDMISDEDAQYSALLQTTIQTLRRRLTELSIHRKISNCDLNLKPLPLNALRKKIVKKKTKDNKNKNASTDESGNDTKETTPKKKKKKKRRKKVKKKATEETADRSNNSQRRGSIELDEDEAENASSRENNVRRRGSVELDEEEASNANAPSTGTQESKDNNSDDDYEWVTDSEAEAEDEDEEKKDETKADDDDDDDNEAPESKNPNILTKPMESRLRALIATLSDIRSNPTVVDLTKHSKASELQQQMFGRQLKIKHLNLKCLKLKKEINVNRRKEMSMNAMNMKRSLYQTRTASQKYSKTQPVLNSSEITGNDRHVNINEAVELGNIVGQIEIPSGKMLGLTGAQNVLLPLHKISELQYNWCNDGW